MLTTWLPGYPDPEYYLRLLLHSDSKTNAGGFAYPPFDALIEQARRERSDRSRLELFHEADRMAVADRVAVIPLFYGQSLAFVKPRIKGWWEFGKSCSSFADLVVTPVSGRTGYKASEHLDPTPDPSLHGGAAPALSFGFPTEHPGRTGVSA